jgi:hypothetical protein
MISVSKLCCPVCWELFKALKSEIKISGCHSTVSPLALPETLSAAISSDITTSLRSQLSSQLTHLLRNKPAPTKIGHLRNESETGHSAASTTNELNSSIYVSSQKSWKHLGKKG